MSLYVYDSSEAPAHVHMVHLYMVHLPSGRKHPWKSLAPPDQSGVHFINPVIVNPDGKAYVYGLSRRLSELFVVSGLK